MKRSVHFRLTRVHHVGGVEPHNDVLRYNYSIKCKRIEKNSVFVLH